MLGFIVPMTKALSLFMCCSGKQKRLNLAYGLTPIQRRLGNGDMQIFLEIECNFLASHVICYNGAQHLF